MITIFLKVNIQYFIAFSNRLVSSYLLCCHHLPPIYVIIKKLITGTDE